MPLEDFVTVMSEHNIADSNLTLDRASLAEFRPSVGAVLGIKLYTFNPGDYSKIADNVAEFQSFVC